MTHKSFSFVALLLSIILWWWSAATHNQDLALITKMVANVALMLVTVTAFGTYYLSRKHHDVWQKIFEHPVALALLLGAIALGSAICSIATLVTFTGV